MSDYIAIATWNWGETAVRAAARLLEEGWPALDAAITGGQAVEDDANVRSVGFGGLGDAAGNVTLDALVMDGRTLNCGAVAGVENIRHVGALARLVMEQTPHVLLVGDGAQQFALRHGFPLETLHTPESVAAWHRIDAEIRGGKSSVRNRDADDHDTVTVLVRDASGDLAGCCTTSGLGHKLPGRVGDSPLIGHGLYVDNEAGAAGGTGDGEEISRIVGSYAIVEAMRSGASAQEACEAAVRRVNAVAARRGVPVARVAFVALDRNGNPGAAATEPANFTYALARPGRIEVLQATHIGAV